MAPTRVYNNALETLKKVKAREAPPDHHVAKEIVELTARSRFSEADGVFHRSRVTVPGIVRAAKLLRRSEWDKIQKFPDLRDDALRWLNEAESIDSYHLHYLRTLQDCTNGPALYKYFVLGIAYHRYPPILSLIADDVDNTGVLDLAMYFWRDDLTSLIDCVEQYGQGEDRREDGSARIPHSFSSQPTGPQAASPPQGEPLHSDSHTPREPTRKRTRVTGPGQEMGDIGQHDKGMIVRRGSVFVG